jgi:hypothetical protein
VVRPRLSDAKFFFEQDKKKTLESRLPLLANVVYHNKLGTQPNAPSASRAWPAPSPNASATTCCWPNAAPSWPRPTC